MAVFCVHSATAAGFAWSSPQQSSSRPGQAVRSVRGGGMDRPSQHKSHPANMGHSPCWVISLAFGPIACAGIMLLCLLLMWTSPGCFFCILFPRFRYKIFTFVSVMWRNSCSNLNLCFLLYILGSFLCPDDSHKHLATKFLQVFTNHNNTIAKQENMNGKNFKHF
jgi:hypothetical protein